jgi:anti-sigma B factor antagonist
MSILAQVGSRTADDLASAQRRSVDRTAEQDAEAAMDFSIDRRSDASDSVRLVLHGEIDLATCGHLREALEAENNAGREVVVVLDQLDYLDSAGIGVLLEACRVAREAGRSFTVTPGGGHVRNVLWISGVLDHLSGAPDDAAHEVRGLPARTSSDRRRARTLNLR